MGRRKRKRKEKEEEQEEGWLNIDVGGVFSIHPDAKKSVAAVLFAACAAILILSSFQKAGPAGDAMFAGLTYLFGWGYYLLPATLFLVALVFLGSERERTLGITTVGSIGLLISGLGIIDILSPQNGGVLGASIGLIELPFGYAAALIIAGAFFAASLITTLNTPIRLKNPFAQSDESADLSPLEEKNIESAEGGEKEEVEETPEEEDEIPDDEPRVAEEKPSMLGALTGKKSAGLKQIHGNYNPPPLSLLKAAAEKPTAGDLRANANIIKRTLESFGVPVEMGEINIGPKVTRYTLKPAEGIKVARINSLNQDLALALASHPIRIEAPIPGKSLVGIEVPNKAAAVVRLGSLLNYQDFTDAGPLGFVLGRDVTGAPLYADLTKMPHLLVAGATGSGKSVMLHSLILSLLYKNSPETLRMVMIDPKRVELTIYNGLPHLVSPVVTDGKKTISVFRWAISEMDRRYGMLESAGNRDIKSYNTAHKKEPLPYVAIVIDELADLMAAYGREIEGSIVRLAQMARATGIHLVVATQRPSVEVITGLIKANITSRVALQVASQIDSRTILDSAGAEKLLGGGDMLFSTAELSKPRRIQGAFVGEEEIRAVADFIRDKNEELDTAEVEFPEKGGESKDLFEAFAAENSGEEDEDEMFDEAVSLVRQAQKASASLLQRRLKVGYARAARLLDIMESRGIIGPGEGAKPREVFITNEEEA